MSWQWTDEGSIDSDEPEEEEGVASIYAGSLMDLVKGPSDSHRKELAVVPLSPFSKYRRSLLGRAGLLLLDAVKKKYGTGIQVPVADLITLGASIGIREREVVHACNRLWGHGIFRKWAMGIWREGQLKRSIGHVGKYFGVHYELKAGK